MPATVVKNQAGEVNEKATKKAFHYAPLVRGMELEFYNRKPPEIWPAMEPHKIFYDHPVMSVSYDDAEAFAEWAGKHIPTEQEWEYAGRGPDAFFYPWGDEWFPDTTHANWGAKNIDEQFKARTMPVATLPEGIDTVVLLKNPGGPLRGFVRMALIAGIRCADAKGEVWSGYPEAVVPAGVYHHKVFRRHMARHTFGAG